MPVQQSVPVRTRRSRACRPRARTCRPCTRRRSTPRRSCTSSPRRGSGRGRPCVRCRRRCTRRCSTGSRRCRPHRARGSCRRTRSARANPSVADTGAAVGGAARVHSSPAGRHSTVRSTSQRPPTQLCEQQSASAVHSPPAVVAHASPPHTPPWHASVQQSVAVAQGAPSGLHSPRQTRPAPPARRAAARAAAPAAAATGAPAGPAHARRLGDDTPALQVALQQSAPAPQLRRCGGRRPRAHPAGAHARAAVRRASARGADTDARRSGRAHAARAAAGAAARRRCTPCRPRRTSRSRSGRRCRCRSSSRCPRCMPQASARQPGVPARRSRPRTSRSSTRRRPRRWRRCRRRSPEQASGPDVGARRVEPSGASSMPASVVGLRSRSSRPRGGRRARTTACVALETSSMRRRRPAVDQAPRRPARVHFPHTAYGRSFTSLHYAASGAGDGSAQSVEPEGMEGVTRPPRPPPACRRRPLRFTRSARSRRYTYESSWLNSRQRSRCGSSCSSRGAPGSARR